MNAKREKRFIQIKENVWRLEEDGNDYAVKRYAEPQDAKKIREIHHQLQAAGYPYLSPMTKKGNEHLVVQSWLTEAVPVDFSKQADRKASLRSLDALHETSEVVDWETVPYLLPASILSKWIWRLERFRTNIPIIEPHLGSAAVDLIERYSEHALNRLQTTRPSEAVHTILHGDVVHHNLLKHKEGDVYLIDFDLACIGHPDIEIGLWMHRVLPNMEYDAARLFEEEVRLQSLGQQAIAMLQYPNELLREWSYFATLPEERRPALAEHLIPFTEHALSYWPALCRFSENELETGHYYS